MIASSWPVQLNTSSMPATGMAIATTPESPGESRHARLMPSVRGTARRGPMGQTGRRRGPCALVNAIKVGWPLFV